MRGKKNRIDTGGGEALAGDNPFGALSSEGMKSGPVVPAKKVANPPKKVQTLHLRRLKAGKGGKVVTEVSGFDMNPQQIDALLKKLQGRLGTGGTRKGKVLELQGEKRAEVAAILEKEGYRTKGGA